MRLTIYGATLILCSAVVLSSCQKEQISQNKLKDIGISKAAPNGKAETKYNTFYGPQEQVGEGHARTFATISHSGVPQEIGVIFTDKALSGLPAENALYSFPFHHKALEATPFENVLLGLSAHGHPLPPSGEIAAHFDVRFMMMTEEERLAIPAPPSSGFDAPPSGYLPANYVQNAALAQVGRHWSYSTVAGTTVNHTMVYGTWNGALTFINPIVTLTTIASGSSYSISYPQPQYFSEHNYYPTKYNIYEDDKGNHYISLSDFVWR